MSELTQAAVNGWIQYSATGDFHYKEVLNSRVNPSSYGKLREYILRACNEGICESLGRKDGWYRPIQDIPKPLDLLSLPARKDSGLILPFNLREYVFIYPNTTVIVAGSKSSGKTGFCYQTAKLNLSKKKVVILSNLEGGEAMMRDRFESMGILDRYGVDFYVYRAISNYHDFIKEENTLYIIDYISAPEGTDFYLIGAEVDKVDRKLHGKNSNAVIGLQKSFGRDLAFGGEQTLRAATLYLALDSKKLKIFDAKAPADENLHPNNMMWTFTYSDKGTCFKNIQRSYNENEPF